MQPCRTGAAPLYTLRSEALPQPSPQEEASWLKYCGDAASDVGGVDVDAADTERRAVLELDVAGAVEASDEAAAPSAAGCGEESYVRLRDAALEFYRTGVVSVHLLIFLGELLRVAAAGGWQQLVARCAPAMLQVLLLRLEERLYIDPAEHAGLASTYLERLHEALGVIPAQGWARWPLAEGWRRAARLQQEVSAARLGYGSGGATVDFVLCYCGVPRSPGGDYPAVTDSLGWLVELLAPGAAAHRNRTRVFIKEKCGDGVRGGSAEALKLALGPVAHVVDVEQVDDALRADDATAYLAHLAGEQHRDLADWTFFLHADAPEHVHPFRLLGDVFAAARGGALDESRFPFLYLSHNYLDLGTSRFTWDDYASPVLWKHLFGSSIAPSRKDVKGYCCVQFLVPRSRLLLRPHAWYARALRWFASADSYLRLFPAGRVVTWQDLTCRTPSQLWMPWWHVVFGEDLAYPERHRDARLPLFVQMRSVPPDRISCC